LIGRLLRRDPGFLGSAAIIFWIVEMRCNGHDYAPFPRTDTLIQEIQETATMYLMQALIFCRRRLEHPLAMDA
jgi:hypothetical protein